MGYQWNVCYDNLTKGGMMPCDGNVGLPYHCNSFQVTTAYHVTCANDTAMYTPVQATVCKNAKSGEIKVFPTEEILDKCLQLKSQDPNWNLGICFCCCACFAHGTLIAAKEAQVQVQEIALGSKILAGSIRQTDRLCLTWEEREVNFSSGTQSGEQPAMVYLVYGDGKELIVSPDHVFLLADGRFITAGCLYPGDRLTDREGNPVEILTASIGHYKGGVHHIATGTDFDGTPNGHLILSGGVVSGDFTLQMNYDAISRGRNAAKGRSMLGTKEYLQSFAQGKYESGKYYFAGENGFLKQNHSLKQKDKFKAYDITDRLSAIPSAAKTLFSPEQESDILLNGTQFPVASTIGYAGAQYVKHLFRGFYPDVDIELVWEMFQPNMYTYLNQGRQTVVISGGLVRMQGLGAEGLALLTAMSVGRFYGKDGEQICDKGAAEFYAAAAMTRTIWFGNMWLSPAIEAFQQVKALFGLIAPDHAALDENDLQEGLAISCRIENLNQGIVGGNMPVCAGGEEKPKLRLERAEETDEGVVLTFNLDVYSGAGDIENYTFDPQAEIQAVHPDENRQFLIRLDAMLEEGTQYRIFVSNMRSIYGTQLDPDASSVAVIRKD